MNWGNFGRIVQLFAPLIMVEAGVPARFVGPAVDLINQAEAIPSATGVDKKAHVLAGIGDVLSAARVKEAPGILDAASHGVDTTIAVVNLLNPKPANPTPAQG